MSGTATYFVGNAYGWPQSPSATVPSPSLPLPSLSVLPYPFCPILSLPFFFLSFLLRLFSFCNFFPLTPHSLTAIALGNRSFLLPYSFLFSHSPCCPILVLFPFFASLILIFQFLSLSLLIPSPLLSLFYLFLHSFFFLFLYSHFASARLSTLSVFIFFLHTLTLLSPFLFPSLPSRSLSISPSPYVYSFIPSRPPTFSTLF